MTLRQGLLHPVTLALPRLPAALQGLTIAHVSDLHVRRFHRPQPRRRLQRLLNQLADLRLDLLLLTGDYTTRPDDTPAALHVLAELTRRVHPALGTFGVFGNHDHPQLVDACQDQTNPAVPKITWLTNQAVHLEHQGQPIDLLGLHTQAGAGPDSVELAHRLAGDDNDNGQPFARPDDPRRPLRLMLAHFPSTLPTASDLGVDALFAGHTHGGQNRLPPNLPLKNSSPLPLHFTTGLQRHRDTAAVISRGLGEMTIPFRLFCPPHAPLITLQQQASPGPSPDRTTRLQHW